MSLSKYKQLLIDEMKSKIPYESHPKAKYWNNKINDIEKGNKTKISQTIIKSALKKSKSKITSKKIENINKIEIKKENVFSYVNRRNLRVYYKTERNDTAIMEIYLTPRKYSFDDLYKIAKDNMRQYNSLNKRKYNNNLLIAIKDFYIVERKLRK